MPGTKIGGLKAAATNKAKYGPNFYRNIGKMGGFAQVPKGFSTMSPQKIREYAAQGGKISKRKKKESYA